MTDFIKEGLKVGDTLYSLEYGEVKVRYIFSGRAYGQIEAIDINNHIREWQYNGKISIRSMTQDLYWSKPEIIAPPRPKRKVINTVEMYINIYPNMGRNYVYESREEAETAASINAIVKAVKLTGTYEVEE